MIEAERKVDNAERERNQLSEENYRLRMRCDNYEQAFKFSSGSRFYDDSLRKFLSTMPSLPKRPCEVAQLAAKVFSDEIDFSERGWSSLDRCTADLNVLWAALRDIATVLHPMLASKESIDVAAEFSSKSRFKYARGEGRRTRKDPKLMVQREDMHQGKKIFIERHVSSSTGDASSKNFSDCISITMRRAERSSSASAVAIWTTTRQDRCAKGQFERSTRHARRTRFASRGQGKTPCDRERKRRMRTKHGPVIA